MGEPEPKQRVLAAFSHREPDRVPINYLLTQASTAASRSTSASILRHRGVAPALGVDFRGVSAPYRGPQLHPPLPDRQIDMWGMHYRWVEHGAGGYWDLCDFPLKDAGLDEVLAWRLPSPDDFDYSGVAESCRRHGEYAVVAGGAGISTVMNFTGRLRSMERMFMDLATDDEAGLCLIDRLIDVRYEWLRRTIEASEGGFDILYMGEDLGTQRGPMISRRLFHKHILPRHRRYIALAKAHGLLVMFHACGSSSWTYDDYIAAGVDIFETLQPEAKDMSPAYLSRLSVTGSAFTAPFRQPGRSRSARPTMSWLRSVRPSRS